MQSVPITTDVVSSNPTYDEVYSIQPYIISVNKQLADKERVAAALENSHLLEVINQCLDNQKRKHGL
jgi:hypothetical protein